MAEVLKRENTKMIERRIQPRKHVSYYLKIYDKKTGELIGQLIDFTTQGMRILSRNPVVTDTDYKLRLDVSPLMNGEQAVFDARCIWQEKEFTSDTYNCGFEILKISKKNSSIIEQLRDQFGS